jgi:hypothetical protein
MGTKMKKGVTKICLALPFSFFWFSLKTVDVKLKVRACLCFTFMKIVASVEQGDIG